MTATYQPGNGLPDGVSPLHPSVISGPSFALVGTYPPTQCGIATFTAALANGLHEVGATRVGVVRLAAGDPLSWDPRVVAEIAPGLGKTRVAAARAINGHDVALMQHEFGIYGGDDGAEVLDLLDDVVVPVLTTLHTVPLKPSDGQRAVLEEVVRRSATAVTMTRIARDRLLAGYDVDPVRVATIPHGATVPHLDASPPAGTVELLTWGLIGPGKGIEWVIDALARIPELRGKVRYTVAGQTHPKVRAARGEEYREMLKARAADLGVADMVVFDGAYRRLPELLEMIRSATCVVLPYDSDDQITSGVLVDALSAGKPVIATGFPHAVELLCGGVGILVPHRDPIALADAISAVANNPALVASMSEATEPVAARHRWTTVAAQYAALGDRFARERSVAS